MHWMFVNKRDFDNFACDKTTNQSQDKGQTAHIHNHFNDDAIS